MQRAHPNAYIKRRNFKQYVIGYEEWMWLVINKPSSARLNLPMYDSDEAQVTDYKHRFSLYNLNSINTFTELVRSASVPADCAISINHINVDEEECAAALAKLIAVITDTKLNVKNLFYAAGTFNSNQISTFLKSFTTHTSVNSLELLLESQDVKGEVITGLALQIILCTNIKNYQLTFGSYCPADKFIACDNEIINYKDLEILIKMLGTNSELVEGQKYPERSYIKNQPGDQPSIYIYASKAVLDEFKARKQQSKSSYAEDRNLLLAKPQEKTKPEVAHNNAPSFHK